MKIVLWKRVRTLSDLIKRLGLSTSLLGTLQHLTGYSNQIGREFQYLAAVQILLHKQKGWDDLLSCYIVTKHKSEFCIPQSENRLP